MAAGLLSAAWREIKRLGSQTYSRRYSRPCGSHQRIFPAHHSYKPSPSLFGRFQRCFPAGSWSSTWSTFVGTVVGTFEPWRMGNYRRGLGESRDSNGSSPPIAWGCCTSAAPGSCIPVSAVTAIERRRQWQWCDCPRLRWQPLCGVGRAYCREGIRSFCRSTFMDRGKLIAV